MKARLILPLVGLVLAGLLAGCTTEPAAVLVIPSAAALPSVTPAPPTEPPTITSPPPTQTPEPIAALSCSERITQATGLALQLCGNTRTDEACLISPGITLGQRAPDSAPALTTPGSRAALVTLARIATGPFDAAAGTWGMALLRTAAQPDAAPFEATTMLLYGDTTVFDAGSVEGPFRSIAVLTGGTDPWCGGGPLPGLLLQNGIGLADTLTINTVQVRFSGTVLVRVPTQAWMEIAVLDGQAEIITPDGGIALLGGMQYFTLLGGDSGFEPVGRPQIQPLSSTNRTALPLAALPRLPSISAPALPTVDTLNQTITPSPTYNIPPTLTPTLTVTPLQPFAGQNPPGGVYLTFEGKRIEAGDRLNSMVPAGGSDRWVFTPRGYGPLSADSFEVQAVGDWNPMLSVESATFGVYESLVDRAEGPLEIYRASLAGSGGDWRITIRDATGGGGAYTISYRCLGPCQPPASDE
ncbi:MAG: hypothetical protein JXN59_07365 [Anaerolineae bacterium]|nr:hypothetical protein [Anaerolineae bacterium]